MAGKRTVEFFVRTFRCRREDKREGGNVEDHARSLGVPDAQLDRGE